MNADSFFYFYNNSNSMKKLIISNFIFLVILNAFVIAKEFLLFFIQVPDSKILAIQKWKLKVVLILAYLEFQFGGSFIFWYYL